LKSLEHWHLTPEQWEQLSDRAVLRFSRFPSIAELYDIVCELQHQAQIKANSDWIARIGEDWKRNHAEKNRADSVHSGLRGPE
jgi:hypothetical protein